MQEEKTEPESPRQGYPDWRRLVPVIAVLVVIVYALYGMGRQRIWRQEASVFGPVTMHIVMADDSSLEVEPEEAMRRAVAAARQVNDLMSPYREDSEISRFNNAAVGEKVVLSPSTWMVVLEALRYHRLSSGAFDVTVAPLIKLYRPYLKGEKEGFPTRAEIASAREKAGSLNISYDAPSRTISKGIAGLEIDPGAIAKGYAVDRATEVLVSLGMRNGLVEIGGEVRLVGKHPEGRAWHTDIEHPRRGGERLLRLEESNVAVATSGDYRQFFEYEDKRYSHIIDPRSGRPVSNNIAGVTVLASTCLKADALSTAVSVMGEQEGVELLRLFDDVEAYLQILSADGSIELKHYPDDYASESAG